MLLSRTVPCPPPARHETTCRIFLADFKSAAFLMY